MKHIKSKETENEQILQRQIEKSERKLEKRNKAVLKESVLEEIRDKKLRNNIDLQSRFVVEVDRAMEEKSQVIASRRYHELQADLAFPEWLKKLLDARNVAASLGHNALLRWRSKCKDIVDVRGEQKYISKSKIILDNLISLSGSSY